MEEGYKAHVQPWKKEMVKQISQDIPKYTTVAIINLENLPSRQSQTIRAKVKEHAQIIITKKRLIKRAIDNCGKEDIKQLKEHLRGMPALILTNKNAFELFKVLKNNMTTAAAKTGQIAPEDIWVKEGPTPFAPGPIIGELGAANIIAGIDGGKVVVKKDSLVVKEGEPISQAAASILSRLDIKPMKIGLNLIAAVEAGKLFERSILNINEEEYIENLKTAILNAKKLALGANILTAETVSIKLQEAYMDAKKLAIGAEILCDETKEHLINKAEAQASTLKKKIPAVLKEEVKEKSQSTEDTTEQSSATNEHQAEQSSDEPSKSKDLLGSSSEPQGEPKGAPKEVVESEEEPAKGETPKADNNPEGGQ